ncbi:MAG: class I SAM-dependent methyltransferase [Pseudomonadota bacterium]
MSTHLSDLPAPFDTRPWDDAAALPKKAAAVPTMLTDEEGRLLHWLARDYASGVGAVCDLGCFAGGSTARLASGIAAAGRTTPVHAFDHFTLTEAQKDRYLYPAGIAPFHGQDMLSAVGQLLAPWQDIIHLRQGDITETDWQDGPIELLFIDAAKTPSAADLIAQTFLPHLIPGRSIVIQQDYLHWRQPWVPAQMELLAECFEIVGWCAKNTVIFRSAQEVTDRHLAAARVSLLEDVDLTDLIGQALCRFPRRPQRAHLARAAMGVQDNPGIRAPHDMTRKAFTPPRVTSMIRDMQARFGP